MPRLLVASLIVSISTYFTLLSLLSGTFVGMNVRVNLLSSSMAIMLLVLGLFLSLLSVRQSWYEMATAYTSHEETWGRLMRILSFFALGICVVNVILAIAYLLSALAL